MNLRQITDMALVYADRKDDAELIGIMPQLVEMVESRLNRSLKLQKAAIRTSLDTVEGQVYYGLPSDFAGLRDIQVVLEGNSTTLSYAAPDKSNTLDGNTYTIIANQLQIDPQPIGSKIEIVYYRKLTPLAVDIESNWVSEGMPDVYIFALLVEISSFIKNPEAVMVWEERLGKSISEAVQDDAITRWSGPSLEITTL